MKTLFILLLLFLFNLSTYTMDKGVNVAATTTTTKVPVRAYQPPAAAPIQPPTQEQSKTAAAATVSKVVPAASAASQPLSPEALAQLKIEAQARMVHLPGVCAQLEQSFAAIRLSPEQLAAMAASLAKDSQATQYSYYAALFAHSFQAVVERQYAEHHSFDKSAQEILAHMHCFSGHCLATAGVDTAQQQLSQLVRQQQELSHSVQHLAGIVEPLAQSVHHIKGEVQQLTKAVDGLTAERQREVEEIARVAADAVWKKIREDRTPAPKPQAVTKTAASSSALSSSRSPSPAGSDRSRSPMPSDGEGSDDEGDTSAGKTPAQQPAGATSAGVKQKDTSLLTTITNLIF